MDCKNIQNVLIDFIEENISEHLKVQIEEHLLTCKNCRTEHTQIRKLLGDLNLLEDEVPESQLQVDFYNMLEEEKELVNKKVADDNTPVRHTINWNFLKYAASAIILLGFGFMLGRNIQIQTKQNSEIAALRTELYSMQQTASMASLTQPTASQRLKAINIINEQVKSDKKTINILINTVKSDENTNVRMAAANALAKYSQNETIRDAFIDVLEKTEDPALQITLINLLTQMRENKAKKAFRKILNDNETIPVVKQQAKEGLKVFI